MNSAYMTCEYCRYFKLLGAMTDWYEVYRSFYVCTNNRSPLFASASEHVANPNDVCALWEMKDTVNPGTVSD